MDDLGAGEWENQKARLKQKFQALTGNDLMCEDGKREEMMKRLQVILGKTKEELTILIYNL
jgi:uncharacterized protein YjbJ (UPF0337 family)